jgi:drug/metabolite transporter (DMT)-like permease
MRGQSPSRDPRALQILVAIGVLNTIGSFVLVTWGQKYVTASYTAILVGSNPIFVSLGAALVLPDERLTRRRIAGVGLGFAGVICLFANELGWGGSGGGVWTIVGALAILTGAVTLAVVAIVVRVHLAALSPAQVALPMLLTGVILMGAVLLTVAATGAAALKAEPTHLGPVATMVVLGVLNAGIGNLVYYTLISNWGVTRTALVGYVVPLIGVTLGVLFLHDPIGLNMIGGLALIILSLLYVNPLLGRTGLAPAETPAPAEL